ncbi:MAG: cation-translocating P-type ATPase [Spirochaetes bacterium]|nr:cation-translocating P-type ATPase [Spirochaetota bacterium]
MTGTSWHAEKIDNVVNKLGVNSHTGLSSEDAEQRLQKYGLNELEHEKKTPPWVMFFGQFKNILIIILIAAIILSALVGEVVDAAIIAVIVIFCAILGFVQEYRAEQALEALKKMLSPTIRVLRNGKEQELLSKNLVPGDIVLLEAGDKIPADARVIETHSLRCDQAALTGESVPVSKSIEPQPAETRISDRKNIVFAGTTVTYGRGKVIVTDTAMQTVFGTIAKEVSAVQTEKTPLEKRTEEIGKWLGIIAIGICVLVVFFSIGREYLHGTIDFGFVITMIMFAVALAVAAVPEALAAIVTGALAIGMRQMAKKNALVRKMPAVETLGCTTVICTDKTGTLTRGEMTVRKIFSGMQTIDVTGAGYIPEGELKKTGGADKPVKPDESEGLRMLLLNGLLCNDADLLIKEKDQWTITGDPTEAALVVLAEKAGLAKASLRMEYTRTEELPFSSERKRMTTVHETPDGKCHAFMKGAPETVLNLCTHYHDGQSVKELTEEIKIKILKINEEMAGSAFRVLGFTYRELTKNTVCTEESVENNMIFLGLTGMIDPPRPEAIKAVEVCKNIRIKPVMITGDHKLTAVAIAKEIGIYNDNDRVLIGDELEKMSDSDLEKIVRDVTVYARVSPTDKLKIVKAWKKIGEVVAMTGDGVNDAPALKHADIGIAMGISGTEVAKEASDMVLTDDNFASIVTAIELGRWIYDNIKKYLTYLLRCNITEVAVIGGVVLILGPEYLPLLPAAILYINLATDGLPALALGVAPPDSDIMKRPPRDPKESVFSWDVRAFIVLAIIIEIPLFLGLFFHDLGEISHARTEMFFLFIIVEMIIALNFRSMRFSIFSAPPHKWLLLAIGWEMLLLIVLMQIPAVREAFGINIPGLKDIGIILGIGALVFLSMEIIKIFIRKRMKPLMQN